MSRIRTLLADPERGATVVQYGLLVALVALVVVATVTQIGEQLAFLYTGITAKLR